MVVPEEAGELDPISKKLLSIIILKLKEWFPLEIVAISVNRFLCIKEKFNN